MPKHIPVMQKEVLEGLLVSSGKNYIDATFGAGGHTRAILQETSPDGFVFACDLDEQAFLLGKQMETEFPQRLTVANGNYKDFPKLLREHNIMHEFHGIICDLGYSSMQIDEGESGFSFKHEGPLDMRFSKDMIVTASDIVNTYSPEQLTALFREYAQEQLAKPIAQAIVNARPLYTTKELADIVQRVYRRLYKTKSTKHPATKVFQALRMQVNQEIENIQEFLKQCIEYLPSQAMIAMITFHSVEDRIVKQIFTRESKQCICPSRIPVCICDHEQRLTIINKKPIIASKEEMHQNPRSRSAKLRLAKKI